MFHNARNIHSNLFSADEERANDQTSGLVVLRLCCLIVVQDVQQHRGEEQHEAASASLNAREVIHCSLREDREPKMPVGHVVIGFLREHVAELVLFHVVRDGKESFDLT